MPNLLIEIGSEELPIDALNVIYVELPRKTEELFRKNRLAFNKINVEATPRRIALFIENLPIRQQDAMQEFMGPSVDKAFISKTEIPPSDHSVEQSKMMFSGAAFGGKLGIASSALEGFLKSKGASIKDVQIKDTPRGRYVCIQKKEMGKTAAVLLPSLLEEIITSLSFPKTMRWEKTGFRFARPIRWVVALLDRKVLASVRFADIKAGTKSWGHRFLAPKSFRIKKADWREYQSTLRRAHVILNLQERKELIREALRSRFRQKNFDEDLVHTTAQLVEEPYFIQGVFSKTYLELPAEVLSSCMKKNQKIFACYDAKGHLMGRFVGVLNGKRRGLGEIRADYENVLESRLRDARYFYVQDTKEPLEKKLVLLEQLVYLGKLGTTRQKTERLEKLADTFAALIGRNDLKGDLKRAARLSKIDLMTYLVYEFPDLQGIAGREYALESGEKEDVATAIGSQYLPKNLGVDYRELGHQLSPLGAMLGILDRLDLLVGAFGIGLDPTGSQDPYALRRAGGGLVKLVRAFGFHFSVSEAVEASAGLYGQALSRPLKELLPRLLSFLQERVAFEIQPKAGSRSSEILSAVFRSSFDDLADVYGRYEILNRLYEKEPEAFIRASKIVERTANILKGVKGEPKAVQPELLKEPLERELFRLLEERSGEIRESLTRRDYEKATLLFGKIFYSPLHDFFNQVMVNTEDPAIRANRQALMKHINRLYTERLADLSLLSRLDQA